MIRKKLRSIKTTDEAWQKLKKLAEERNISMSSYIEKLINMEIPKPIPPDAWARMYSELAEIRNKFEDLYKIAIENGEASYEDFESVIHELNELRTEMVEIGLGKVIIDAGDRYKADL